MIDNALFRTEHSRPETRQLQHPLYRPTVCFNKKPIPQGASMEDDKDISPPVNPPQHTDNRDNEPANHPIMDYSEEFDPATLDYSSVPLFEEFRATRSKEDITREVIAHYASFVKNVPHVAFQTTEEMEIDPIFIAPTVTQAEGNYLAREHLMSGVRINIPRSSKLWTGDQLRLRWGSGTYCSPISEPTHRKGPREVRWLSGAHLGRSTHGMIQVSYEVFRRSRLVGISESLTLWLTGDLKRSPQQPEKIRLRAIRRRKRP
jgi:hypothetical protein